MKAFGWAADNGGCRWYRLAVPFAELARRGHAAGHQIRYTADWDDADVIVAQRVCNPGPSTLWQQWAEQGRRLVYDADDDYFHVGPESRAAWEFFGRGDVQRRICANVEMASVVTVCSDRLAEVIRPYNPTPWWCRTGCPPRSSPGRCPAATTGW